MASRHPNGVGTVYRRKDGRFEGAAFVPIVGGTRRRVHVYGKTHTEATEKLRAKLTNAERGIPEASSSWTVSAYMQHWLNTTIARRARPLTQRSYESLIRRYIDPLLGSKKLSRLSANDVQAAIDALLGDGKSPRTLQKIRSTLRSALSSAMRQELVFRNVASLAEVPQWERKPIRPWSAQEARDFLTAADAHIWSIGYLLLLTYGMREGEVLGLTWNDIDFNKNLFHVRQQIQRIDGKLRAVPVKTAAGQRTLPLVPRVRAALLKLAEQRGIRLDLTRSPDAPTGFSTNGLIVTSLTGGPVEAQNFLRAFRTLTAHAGLRPITIHHTRHTVATLLASLGVPARDAQLILGHANITTTQQIYQHGDHTVQREAITTIAKALSGGQDMSTDAPAPSNETGGAMPVTAVDGNRCRQMLPSTVAPSTDSVAIEEPLPGDPTGVNASHSLGGSSQTRTGDTRLFRSNPVGLEALPTPVISSLHTRTRRHILGLVAVKTCRQTVASVTRLDELRTTRHACRAALTAHLRRRSFPLNLIPSTPEPDLENAA